MCFPPLYNVLGTVTERVPLFVHALLCIALRLVPLAVAALLGHVPHFLARQPGDERIQLAFWEHMTNIPQEVAFHLGIC